MFFRLFILSITVLGYKIAMQIYTKPIHGVNSPIMPTYSPQQINVTGYMNNNVSFNVFH